MEKLFSVFVKPQEEVIDEQKLRQLASKVAISDHFGIPQAHYLALDKNEKSKMLNEYYNKLLPIYFVDGKNYIFLSLDSGFFSVVDPGLFLDDVWKFYFVCFRRAAAA